LCVNRCTAGLLLSMQFPLYSSGVSYSNQERDVIPIYCALSVPQQIGEERNKLRSLLPPTQTLP